MESWKNVNSPESVNYLFLELSYCFERFVDKNNWNANSTAYSSTIFINIFLAWKIWNNVDIIKKNSFLGYFYCFKIYSLFYRFKNLKTLKNTIWIKKKSASCAKIYPNSVINRLDKLSCFWFSGKSTPV